MISPADLGPFRFVDDPASALLMLQTGIAGEPEATRRCPSWELQVAANDAPVVSI
jgi:hypothetical protein